jgi:predicted kinase
MNRLIIPVGLPGCGKSSFAVNFGIPVVSTDQIRAEEFGDVNDMSNNDAVFELYHARIEEGLFEEGLDATVYADATNLRDFARRKLLDIAYRMGAESHVLLFTNTQQAVIRNTQRERRVPDDVMVRFVYQLEEALKDVPLEGYTSVTCIDGIQGVIPYVV